MSKYFFILFWIVFLCLVNTPTLLAKEMGKRNSISLNFSVGSPVGNTNFNNETIYGIPQFKYEYTISSYFSTGLSLAWAYANEKNFTSDFVGSDIVSGFSKRTLKLLPLQAEFNYFPFGVQSKIFKPYLGISAGMQYASYSLTGDFINTFQSANVAAVFSPKLGIRYQFPTDQFFIDLGVHWMIASNEWALMHISSYQECGVKLGFGYTF